MKFLVSAALVTAMAVSGFAQDGIYVTFSAGQKLVGGIDTLNGVSKTYEINHNPKDEFKPTFFNLSGEVHFIMGKRFVLGGKGFLFSQEQKATFLGGGKKNVKGIMGTGNVGFSILDGKSNGLRVFPQIGIGVSSLRYQVVDEYSNEDIFAQIHSTGKDYLGELQKKGLLIDACLAIDYDLQFIPGMSCMSGISALPLLHIEFGYNYTPKKLPWMCGAGETPQIDPDLTFTGLYYSFGIGFGFSGKN
jgi:hypothetical protein